MFLYCRDSLQLSEACIQSLSASLNAPVVHTDDLPPGPARAAIVVFAEEYGDLGLAVGLRSLEAGEIALYKYRVRVQSADEVPAAMEDALSFAEGLGFLFDEDMIDSKSGSGRQEALDHWNRLMGKGEVFRPGALVGPPSPAIAGGEGAPDEDPLAPMDALLIPDDGGDAAPAELLLDSGSQTLARGPGASDSSEMLLDDLMDFADEQTAAELSLDVGAESAGAERPVFDDDLAGSTGELIGLSPEPAAGAGVPLSRFRRATAEPSPPAESPAAQKSAEADAAAVRALGRIAIVKRRTGGGDPAKPSVLTRLLTSF